MKKLQLSKVHLAELKTSGLSLETIQAAGIYTERDVDKICQMLNHANVKSLNDSMAMVIPFEYDGYCRVKLSSPRLRAGSISKYIKYESPIGSTQHPYFPPGVFDQIYDEHNDKDIFIVEGEKKALKLWQELKDNEFDVLIIGLTGVYGWKEPKHEKLIDWLDTIHWTNRGVYVCFDNDVHWNRNVLDARKRLAKILRNLGANVMGVDIPITDPSQKYGLDDYIVKFGMLAYLDCISKAKKIDTHNIINLEIVSAAEIDVVPVEWLWKQYIPRGEITLIDGNPGLGKSQMIADLAARVSRGYPMPPLEPTQNLVEPLNVLLLCAEDTVEKTVKPRLYVCGANMGKVFFPKTHGKQLIFPQDIERFEQECLELNVGLVVIDPIMSFISRDIDTHSDQSTREVLNRIKEFAEHTNISVIALRHLNKRSGDAAIFRGGGSIAFTAASRCNLIVGRHPTDDNINVLACVKSNLDRKPISLSYTIDSIDTKWGSIGRITWLDEIELEADDVVDTERVKKVNRMDKAIKICKDLLTSNGPMLSIELMAQVVKKAEISSATWNHAKKQLGLIRGRNFEEGRNSQWYVKLAGQSFYWEVKKRKGDVHGNSQ